MGDIFLWISLILGMLMVGAFINTLFSEDSIFDIIDSRVFYRLIVLALLCHGIYIGYGIHEHFHSIEDLLQKVENVTVSEKDDPNGTDKKPE